MLKYKLRVKILLFLISICFFSCQKKEFQVPEEGVAVPYLDSVIIKLTELIMGQNDLLFAKIWQKVDMDKYLNEIGGSKGMFTILQPTNEAMIQAGWTDIKISNSSSEHLLEFLKKHIVLGKYTPQVLELKQGNVILKSLYEIPDFSYTYNVLPYHFSIALAVQDQNLYVNGLNQSKLQVDIANNGCIYHIHQVLEAPNKTAWEQIKSNPQFSIYSELMEKTDSIYLEVFKKANGYYPYQGHKKAQAYNRISSYNFHMSAWMLPDNTVFVDDLNTFFIPTNQAFLEAGFSNVEDLLQFNKERGYPKVDWEEPEGSYSGFYKIIGGFATDSLLDYHHNWGLLFANPKFSRDDINVSIFSNDFKNPNIKSIPIASYSDLFYSSPGKIVRVESYFLENPFLFGENRMSLKNGLIISRLVVKDIQSLNGVIHGVDRILINDKFFTK